MKTVAERSRSAWHKTSGGTLEGKEGGVGKRLHGRSLKRKKCKALEKRLVRTQAGAGEAWIILPIARSPWWGGCLFLWAVVANDSQLLTIYGRLRIGTLRTAGGKKIHLTNLDAEEFLEKNVHVLPKQSLIYFDPPYFVKGGDLYLNSYKPEDHKRLAQVIQNLQGVNWILSYDAADEILKMYSKRKKIVYNLQYHAADRYSGTEVFIFADNMRVPVNSELPYINSRLADVI